MGVRALKHAALLREWSGRIMECRSSGMTVKAWCEGQGISIKTYYYWERHFIEQAGQQGPQPVSKHAGPLMRINPDNLPCNAAEDVEVHITIRHGKSIISFPVGSSAESIADLVKALNRNA